MIPTVPTDDQLGTYVSNMIAVWQRATVDETTEGRSWYRVAHGLADMISSGDVRRGAGVLAALSPQTAWERNIDLAADAFATGEPTGHLGDALRKAARIMAGEDPLSVLPDESKTWHFYRCIVDPDDADSVVIDRHAHDVAIAERYEGRDRGLSNRRRYAALALAYRLAARRLGEIPNTVQAVTWVVWRNMIINGGE